MGSEAPHASPAARSLMILTVAAIQPLLAITATAVMTTAIGVTTAVWQVLRAGGWAARGLRVPSRNALLADVVPANAYGRAYGFERAMDNLGAIGGPLLALALVALVGVRSAILLSIVPGLLAALAIVIAIRFAPKLGAHQRRPLRNPGASRPARRSNHRQVIIASLAISRSPSSVDDV